VLGGPAGGMTTLTNHAAAASTVTLRLPEGAQAARVVSSAGRGPLALENGRAELRLDGFGASIVEWDRRS
jgi:hypothetical protein